MDMRFNIAPWPSTRGSPALEQRFGFAELQRNSGGLANPAEPGMSAGPGPVESATAAGPTVPVDPVRGAAPAVPVDPVTRRLQRFR